MVYFTSDLHFYHKNIMSYSPAFRSYADVDEMNKKLIELWNDTVTPEDTVYNLGDFSMCANTKKVIEIAKKLNGKHYLILGNHDYPIKSDREKLMQIIKDDGNKLFEDIKEYKLLRTPEGVFALSHFPMAGWEEQQRGSIMLYGHLHDYISEVKGKILNVGFDLHGKLLSLNEVLDFVKDLPTLPYRREDNERMVAIKASSDTAVRKKMIADELKRINSTYDTLDNLTAEKLASFKTLAQSVASEIVDNFKNGNFSESPSINLADFQCDEVNFFLNERLKAGVFFYFSEGDDANVETLLYSKLRSLIPQEFEIKVALEW